MTDAQAQDHAHPAAHAFAEVAASHPSRAAVRHADTARPACSRLTTWPAAR
jgi:hypothetical protein